MCQADEVLHELDGDKICLYIAEANKPKTPSNTTREHERAITSFTRFLKQHAPANLSWKHQYLHRENIMATYHYRPPTTGSSSYLKAMSLTPN